jgi:hypothetical protein
VRSQELMWACVSSLGIGVVLVACGGGPAAPSASSSATASVASPSSASGSATAAITANWQEFFNAKTPVARRVQLLQNGEVFAPVIKAQSGSALASEATAKATKVMLVSPTQAKVTYSILVSGTPQLTNQSGVAVLQNGTWKVGDASFCGLLALENGGKTSGLPAACHTAG